MKHAGCLWIRLSVLLTGLLLVSGFTASAMLAQEVPTEIGFTVSKYTCDQDPGNVSVAAGNIPEDCVPTGGVTFTVATDDGAFTGTCTTDGTGNCTLQVPNEATVTVTEDTTTAPAGTAPRENPITTQAVTEFAGALFINLPTAPPVEPEPPAEISFLISKYTCDQDPGNVSVNAGNIPDYCAPTAGVAFSVTAEDGTVIGGCTTDDTGMCRLMVANEATVTVTEDTTTTPALTVPRENPITTQAVTEFAGALFINLPAPVDAQPTEPAPAPTAPSVPTTLPSTGSGTPQESASSILASALIGASMACGAAAWAMRRRHA